MYQLLSLICVVQCCLSFVKSNYLYYLCWALMKIQIRTFVILKMFIFHFMYVCLSVIYVISHLFLDKYSFFIPYWWIYDSAM